MNLSVRDARREDHPAFARLFAELRVPDPTPSEEVFEARIRPNAFFLWDDVGPVGYAFFQVLEDLMRVIHVVVDPRARGRGVGAAVMREVAARARRAGCTRWTLNVKPDNVPALRLYESFGMRRMERAVSMKIAWSDVEKLPHDEGIEAFRVAEEDEPLVEAKTGLARGQLAPLRRGGGWVLLGLRREGEVVAFAAFDPSFPGASPFTARTPGVARALLEAMRAHARPGHDFVRFSTPHEVVEQAARAAGAEVMLEILRMEGAVP